ncbi:MAG: radical SAM protein [Candidatus Lokiarchaeota archaeon]|nr:radical SAM protein [Candidatus Lokiarchaeota archaeon]
MPSQDSIYYCHPVFRPPSEANSLLIQLTEGCTYRCNFCISNLRKNFKIRAFDDIKKDIDIAKKIYGENIKRIFFLDGNGMITPFQELVQIIDYVNDIFPHVERCAIYAHSKDILKKTDTQLEELSNSGLKMLYVGFESGYNELLNMINKRAKKEDHIRASKKLFKANITLSATLINGLSGANNPAISKEHAIESADLINRICPDDDSIWYISFLSLMIPKGTEIYNKKVGGEFYEMSAEDILNELKLFIQHINFKNPNANCIFRANHASNYLPIKGILEKDKEKILETIDYGLTNKNILRPDFYRRL